MEEWTKMRDVAVQICPWLDIIPKWAHFAACSKSASSKTMSGDFPPVSKVIDLRFTLAAFIITFAVVVDPVKAILSILGCDAIAAPASGPRPLRRLTTPGGKPASLTKFAMYRMLRGVCSAAFRTIVFPHARAGPSFHAAINRG